MQLIILLNGSFQRSEEETNLPLIVNVHTWRRVQLIAASHLRLRPAEDCTLMGDLADRLHKLVLLHRLDQIFDHAVLHEIDRQLHVRIAGQYAAKAMPALPQASVELD